MDVNAEVKERLRAAGLKVTPQRLFLLAAVRRAEGHATARELLKDVQRTYPYIDETSFSRNLTVFRDRRLVNETKMGSGDLQYEYIGGQPHHHLICRSCGDIIAVSDSVLQGLAMALTEHHGFLLEAEHLVLPGLCRSCRKTRDEAESPRRHSGPNG